jgi:hypothetical protein
MQVKLSDKFHVLKGVTYKSGVVPTMMVDVEGKHKNWKDAAQSDAPQAVSKSATSSAPPTKSVSSTVESTATSRTLMQETGAKDAPTIAPKAPVQSAPKSEPAIKKGFLNKGNSDKPAQNKPSSAPSQINSGIQEISSNSVPPVPNNNSKISFEERELCGPVPKYSMVERGVAEMGDFERGMFTSVKSSRYSYC